METNKIITMKDLIDKDACRNGKIWFQENFGEETDIETLKKKLIEKKEWNYLEWLFKNLKLTGEFIYFYEDGQIMTKCFYKNGEREGIRTFYNIDSSINFEEKYNNGKLIETKYY